MAFATPSNLILRSLRSKRLEGWAKIGASWFSRRCEASSSDASLFGAVRNGLAFARPARARALLTMRDWPVSLVLEQSPAGNVIDLEPDAIGILEQHRVISGRPAILARRADDFRAKLDNESVELVDIGALAGAKAEMVQPDAPLVEGSIRVFRRRRADAERGASADAIIIGVGIDDRRHAEERQQLAIEIARAREIRRRQDDVRHTVDFHASPLPCAIFLK